MHPQNNFLPPDYLFPKSSPKNERQDAIRVARNRNQIKADFINTIQEAVVSKGNAALRIFISDELVIGEEDYKTKSVVLGLKEEVLDELVEGGFLKSTRITREYVQGKHEKEVYVKLVLTKKDIKKKLKEMLIEQQRKFDKKNLCDPKTGKMIITITKDLEIYITKEPSRLYKPRKNSKRRKIIGLLVSNKNKADVTAKDIYKDVLQGRGDLQEKTKQIVIDIIEINKVIARRLGTEYRLIKNYGSGYVLNKSNFKFKFEK